MGYDDIKKHYDCYKDKLKCNTTLENGITDDVLDQLCQLQTELENGGTDDLLFDIYDVVNLSVTTVSEAQHKEMGNTDDDIMEMRKLNTLVESGVNITSYFDEKEPDVVIDRKNNNDYIDDSVESVSVGESAIIDNSLVVSDKSAYIDDDIDDIDDIEDTDDSDMGYIDDDIDETDTVEIDEAGYIDDDIDTENEEVNDNVEDNDDMGYIDDDIDEDMEEESEDTEDAYIDDDIDEDTEDVGSSAIEFKDEEDYIDDDIDDVAEDSMESESSDELSFDNNDNYVDDDVNEEDSTEENDTVESDYRERRMEEIRNRRREQFRNRHRPDYDYDERYRRRAERHQSRHYDNDENRGINVNNDNKFVQNSDEPVMNGKPNDIINSDNKCVDEKLADLLLRISNGILTSPQTVKKSLSKLRVTDDDTMS